MLREGFRVKRLRSFPVAGLRTVYLLCCNAARPAGAVSDGGAVWPNSLMALLYSQWPGCLLYFYGAVISLSLPLMIQS